MTADQPTPDKAETDADLKSKAYSRATTRLRTENPDLWNTVLGEEYRKVGIDWTPKPTEAQKAKRQIDDLLARHPELLAEITGN